MQKNAEVFSLVGCFRCYRLSALTPLRQYIGDPAVKKNEEEQVDKPFQISPKDIEQPVIPFQNTRIADREQIVDSIELQWEQNPMIAPFPHGFRQAQIEQKSVVHNVVLGMAGRIGRKWDDRSVDMNGLDMGIGTRTPDEDVNQRV